MSLPPELQHDLNTLPQVRQPSKPPPDFGRAIGLAPVNFAEAEVRALAPRSPLPLENALLKCLHEDTFKVDVKVTGPDVAGFFHATASVIDAVEGQGQSRSPTSALAYALEAAADQLLGMKT